MSTTLLYYYIILLHTHTQMGIFDNKLYNFAMLFIVSAIVVQIMTFLDIEYVFYISYLLWFIAIGIFVIILPRGNSSVI
jgi:hypothetical protein